jgi:putative sigma-54 modulation protein
MSVDEAITQMELLDHEFYMFKNEETHAPAVVYKRNSGGYGLIESLE